MRSDQLDAIDDALGQIDQFLRFEFPERLAKGGYIEPQRDFTALLDNAKRLRAFAFFYTEDQLGHLDRLLDSVAANVNALLKGFQEAVDLKNAQPDIDQQPMLETLNRQMQDMRTAFVADARGFQRAIRISMQDHSVSEIDRSIFICYRRSDSHWVVDRIYRQLSSKFHQVFRDLDSIPLGVPFADFIREALRKVNNVLVVIGPTWTQPAPGVARSRLFEPNDFVRIELEIALNSPTKVVPVLLAPAKMPDPAELPTSIQQLARLNAIEVRPDPDFDADMARLIRKLTS